MKRHGSVLIVVVLVLLVCTSGAQDKSANRVLSADEARDLVYEALRPTGATKLPKFGLDQYKDRYFPEFLFFESTWENPEPGSAVNGHFAVDLRTGDVWETVGCKRFTTPFLRKLQEAIHKRFGLTEKEYRKLKRKKPC